MKRIAFVNTKGGVGKTTATILTGLSLAKKGFNVLVKDADPSGGSWKWQKKARGKGTPLPFRVETAAIGEIEELGEEEVTAGYDYILIDTPPVMQNTMGDAVENVSDVIVIVTRPGHLDSKRTRETFKSFAKARAVLINCANIRQKTTKETIEEIDAMGFPRFDTIIPERESTHRAGAGNNQVPTDSGFIEFAGELSQAVETA